ncbi:MAG: hypothetical protein GY717_15560 [Rhodobacteraceae bacterium]|nr:hypothetical protein [Paracoccaceae bacterium]
MSAVALRPPGQVMQLERLGSLHQSRLSFMRILLRRMRAGNWRIKRRLFEIDKAGVGVALYEAQGPERSYTLVAFAHDLPPEKRSDRVIAKAWDATFTLFDGAPEQADIDRLAQNVPLQEAGRVSVSELSVSRANRSVRLWEHVVTCLAQGHQPDAEKVAAVGYLMRTTAVYGSGKLGAADRGVTEDRPECHGPFQIEMLSVYLTRCFVMDLVEHMARARSPDTAVPLDPGLRRRFGIGNSTGLGLAPFLVNHPVLLNNWIATRETALARVRSVETAAASEVTVFRDRLDRAIRNAADWRSEHPMQIERLGHLRADLDALKARLEGFDFAIHPWDRLYRWAEDALSVEGQEQLVSLLLEPYGELVDDLEGGLAADEAAARRIDGAMSVADLRRLIKAHYGWALAIDWTQRDAQARAWYVSEEKLEPRLGERFEEPIAEYEQPLAPGRDAAALARDLHGCDPSLSIADFLTSHPEHRHIVRRVQLVDRYPYAEIRDNTIAAHMMPIDWLRCKLACFGATHFDPRSDRWVRINMFQNAPFPPELPDTGDDWAYPEVKP